ncbi:polysaccharide deacetylase family protein [Roseomonas aerophila]|uniref:Chitooligosaccharide deacetylase n=1 Tax=Teichococcus aerophilus TaxID=1224513 RepID=A0ABR7RMF7_9PROT|nr:polysaccharide deacetylase family protein [Pseudoroseomonas aerophila]MBC9207785.1 polysaccharide deacetylase family protein [Pseudoroseomonas aerophila]
MAMASRRAVLGAMASGFASPALAAPALPQCRAGTLYLTIDTGWGREAEMIAAVLRRREVKATLFLADEPDFRGGTTLGPAWAGFWRERAAEGHAFGSHTTRHWYFTGDVGADKVRYASRRRGEGSEVLDGPALCAELARPIALLRQVAPEAQVLPLWRAPGGRTTPNALRLAAACGLRHQGWSANGFLGDELDSAAHPNQALLAQALRRTRDGEVLLMHWGVRSRREPFGLVFEDVVSGLQARGFCFATLPASGT